MNTGAAGASPVMAQTSLDRAEALLAEMGDDCRQRLDELLAQFPQIGIAVMRELALRLEQTNQQLARCTSAQ